VGFSLQDIKSMTGGERTEYLDLYREEVERENAELDKVKSAK